MCSNGTDFVLEAPSLAVKASAFNLKSFANSVCEKAENILFRESSILLFLNSLRLRQFRLSLAG